MERKKIVMTAGAIVGGVVILAAAIFIRINSGQVRIKNKAITIEAGEQLEITPEDLVKANDEVMKELKLDTSKVDTEKVGTYSLVLSHKEKTYKIQVSVVDTTAPKVTFAQRYLFTNNLSDCDISKMYQSVTEYSAYDATFTSFEKTQELEELTADKLTALEEAIVEPCDQKALAEKTSQIVPDEEGIYRAVVKIEDEYKNACYEEVFVILDRTAPVIEDHEDEVRTTEDLNTKPTVDPGSYRITDNADGMFAGADITCEVDLADEKNHVYINHVSCTDRAGNTATADFQITLVKGKDTGKTSASSGNKNQGTAGSASANSSSQAQNSGTQSASSDYVEEDELTEGEKLAVKAGYYQVVVDSDGAYFVLVKSADEFEKGDRLIVDYLDKMGYEDLNMNGHNLGGPNWNGKDFIVVCTRIREKSLTPDDEGFWRG